MLLFGESGLKYAAWSGSSWAIRTVDSSGAVGEWNFLALDSNGFPHISYRDSTNGDLKFADGVPEPGTITLLSLGLVGLGVQLRRRKQDA